MSSYDEAPTDKSVSGDSSSLAARRARLRGSLARAMPDPYASPGSTVTPPPAPAGEEPTDQGESVDSSNKGVKISAPTSDRATAHRDSSSGLASNGEPVNGGPSGTEPQAVPSPGMIESNISSSSRSSLDEIQEDHLIELLSNIDQSVGICTMNLGTVQKVITEQNEVLAQLGETMRTQTFSELGLNLSSLVESLSAALEPMKAVGELVPAIDQLVSLVQAKELSAPQEPKLTPDQLLMNLAEQLAGGLIDAVTFNLAYGAAFPSDQPADLMHRLVTLFGNQRISGELFRAAYDAVQTAEPPATARSRSTISSPEGADQGNSSVQDGAMLVEFESLRRSQEELQERDKQRELETNEKLKQAQEQLNSRLQEFNERYEELSRNMQARDERLQERESELAQRSQELAEKDSENQVLKAQIEELREQMLESVKELQNQVRQNAQAREEQNAAAAKPASGFFDVTSGQARETSPFDTTLTRPLFQQAPQRSPDKNGEAEQKPSTSAGTTSDTAAANQEASQQIAQTQETQRITSPNAVPSTPPAAPAAPAAPSSNQPVPLPPAQGAAAPQVINRAPVPGPSTFVSGTGSYGTGVRAQVFEVIVRQALAGAPWREICANPMQVNNISADEVEAEVRRRQALLKK
jgi:hypothetical protein